MRVAIVGSGIAGLACARALAGRAEVTVLEAAERVGGHVYTEAGVDMGFIVFSRPSYPGFSAMLDELGVASRPTTMSFSVCDGEIEWSSASPRGWFAQPRNLVRASHWRFLGAVVRLLAAGRADLGGELVRRATLDEYLEARRVPADVRERFVVPLAAALWSLAPERCGAFPAETWLRFLDQHGMLRATRPHPWRTVVGGSATYVEALVRALGERVRIATASPVTSVVRDGRGVTLVVGGRERRFDHVVVATHADTALALLGEPTADERALLGAFAYSHNPTVLHGDATFLPEERAAWASWNYVGELSVTYWMNRLQGLPEEPLRLVTVNPPREPAGVVARTDFMHPQFDFAALAAQRSLSRLQGVQRTYFAGAYAGFGFHEDGFRAGVRAAARVLAAEVAA
jgi:predicted NAD/FAD-binding protein